MYGVKSDPVSSDFAIGELRRKFNESSFVFRHGLSGHPLFDLERLSDLGQQCGARKGDLLFDAGDIRPEQKWGEISSPADLTFLDAMARINTAGAWIIMKHVEKDPEYAKVLRQYTEAIFDWAEVPFRPVMKNPEML